MKSLKPNRLVNIDARHILELRDPLLGATVVRSVNYEMNPLVAAMTDLLNSFKVPPPSSLVSNYSFYCLPVVPNIWTEFAEMLAADLNEQLLGPLQVGSPFEFDDLYLTRYFESESGPTIGVGPHRDTNCKGIVATLILKGQLPFAVCQQKDGSDSVAIPVDTGELLLMRAEGCGNLCKPIHYVGEIGRRSVIQFGLRQYIKKKK